MDEMIDFNGVETNNLNDIDVSLKKHAVNLVLGPSGSGKSSLAFDTVGLIGQHEMTSMFADEVVEPMYRVKSYRNMIAAVPIQQSNNNNNIRSTIGTYFGINRSASLLYSALLGVDEDYFVLNKEGNVCDQCLGLGLVHSLDPNRIIDYDVPLEKCPFRCWTRNRDFYAQIIRLFCIDQGIDPSKNFRRLTKVEKHVLLLGESKKKYCIKYKRAGIISSRTTKYHGVLTDKPMLRKFAPGRQFLADHTCPSCNGYKYSPAHHNFKLHQLSIGDFMCTPFADLDTWLQAVCSDTNDSSLRFAASQVSRFVRKALDLDLGHLFFHRAIPTLSGGELQRLRLVQVFNTQLSDLLIVLDEPLAGLSGKERLAVYDNIVKLSKQHTLLIVDHYDTFLKKAKVVIALGEGGGKSGGNLIDAKKFLRSQTVSKSYTPPETGELLSVSLNSPVYEFKGVNLKIAKNALNVVSGKSGIGKTTLLREYFPQCFANYIYVKQEALVGKKNSSVVTALGILDNITREFAKEFSKDKGFFSKLSGGKGACRSCSGVGYIDFGNDYRVRAQIECRECNGTGFSSKLQRYRIREKSILDVLLMTIDEASDYYHSNRKIREILEQASEIMLGHLQIGQPTSTLSGGENIRVKILRAFSSTAKIYGIDEPFKGLCLTEVYRVIQFFNKLVEKKKTVIVAEHVEESFRFFTRKIRLIERNGKLVEGH